MALSWMPWAYGMSATGAKQPAFGPPCPLSAKLGSHVRHSINLSAWAISVYDHLVARAVASRQAECAGCRYRFDEVQRPEQPSDRWNVPAPVRPAIWPWLVTMMPL
jgi:hypothetical protein